MPNKKDEKKDETPAEEKNKKDDAQPGGDDPRKDERPAEPVEAVAPGADAPKETRTISSRDDTLRQLRR